MKKYGEKKNPKCPHCGSENTIKKESRRGKKRYLCKDCLKKFSINHQRKSPCLWTLFVDGLPFRKLALYANLSHSQAYERVKEEMLSLPSNTDISKRYSDPSKWSGILNLDGRYIKIVGEKRPTNKKSIPFLWGVDFLSHDFPLGILVPSESEKAFFQYFQTLKEIGYPLRVVVCDGVSSLKPALLKVFPSARIQLCHTHFLENIRQELKVRSDETYRHFFNSLCKWIFRLPKNEQEREIGFAHVYHKHAKDNLLLQTILLHIKNHEEELFLYQKIAGIPATNNIIESFNSHLKGRLKTMKGFQTFSSAQTFLNAWLIRRRTRPFTDCTPSFKHLNGTKPLEHTIKDNHPWPQIPGI